MQFHATPVDARDPTSAWLTARRKALDAVRKVLGPSDYQARAGACTWANAVYWLEILAKRPDGLLVVRNVTKGAKRKVEAITAEIEPNLVFPLLRGRDVHRWEARPSLHILMMQDPKRRRGLDEEIVQQRYPKTWAYLKRFEGPLRERSGFKRYFTRKQGKQVVETGPFYSMFNVGDYTFAPWKVVWRGEVATSLVATVINSADGKVITPDQTAYLVPFDQVQPAYFLCALLNSSIIQLIYAMHTYKHVSMNFIQSIQIPNFDSEDDLHHELARLSQRAHELAPEAYAGDKDTQAELRRVEAEIDRAAAALWGLSDAELADIQASLQELKG